MFCFKCGNQLPDNASFCNKCGAIMQPDDSPAQQNAPPPDHNQYAGPAHHQQAYAQPSQQSADYGAPPPKKGIPKFIFIIAAAVVVIVVAAILLIPALAGNSYQKAEMKFLSGLASGANANGRWDFTLEYQPSSQLMKEADIYDIEIDGSLMYADQEFAARLAVWDDGDLISEILCAFDQDGLSVAFPDITEYYLRFLTGDIDSDFDFSSLDNKKLQATITEIGKKYFAFAKEIAVVEKGVPLSFASTSVKCDVYTMEFREKAVGLFMSDVLKEVRKNTNLVDFITEFVIANGGRQRDVEKQFDNMEDFFDELDTNRRLFQMTVWVSGGEIVARQIDKVADVDFALSYQNLVKGSDAHIELKASWGGRYKASFTGDFEKSRDGWNGSPKLSVTDTRYNEDLFTLKAKCENMDRSGDAVLGTIKIDGTIQDELDYSVKLTLGKDGNRQTIKVDLDFDQYDYWSGKTETYDVGSLILSYAFVKNGKLDMPKFDEDLAVMVGDYSSSNSKRAERMYDDLDKFTDKYKGNQLFSQMLWQLTRTLYYMY